ncbi:hypothetical protein ON010_g5979 [Phytophthora cinnamomi]|nr:hypothetical protein ON010_g5979 [Phytophthora cinnamomi]
MIRSDAVLFKPLPGVLTRLYGWQFGTRGLSVMHFAQFHQDSRIAWYEAGGANFENSSATAELGPAKHSSSLEAVIAAARVLQTYAREYCCSKASELTDVMVAFLNSSAL